MGRALDLVRHYVESATELIEPPVLSPELIAEPRLKDYPVR